MKGKASINRIRLEFKVKKATTWAYDKFGINRIRLEFKVFSNDIW